MTPRVTVYEVGPRDGLQNEAARVPTEGKLALIRALAEAGLPRVEATSFVSPTWIPQLADAAEVVAGLTDVPGTSYGALVPNARGLERLLAALAAGLEVRGYVSTAFGCPYEGAVDEGRVAEVALRLLALGCGQVSLGDTIGVATPPAIRRVLRRLLATVPADRLALHGHDTRGTALANVLAALEEGLTTFDAAVGGLGGCPYAPGASGNLATEDLVYLLHGLGLETGVDPERLTTAGALAQRLVGRRLPGKALQAALAARGEG